MQKFLLVFLVATVLVAGCIGQQTTSGPSDLAVTATADPAQIRSAEEMQLFIDLENKGQQDIKDIVVEVFDTGPLAITAPQPGACIVHVSELRPAQLSSAECNLAVAQPEQLIQTVTPATISLSTKFQKSIAGTFVIDVLSSEEFRRLETIGKLEYKPQSYSFGDTQLQATVQFNKAPPFVSGDLVTAQLKISNTGPGYADKLEPFGFVINQQDQMGQAFICDFSKTLYSFNGVFPPITCTFKAADNVATAANYPVTLTIDYNYELRQSVSVSIKK